MYAPVKAISMAGMCIFVSRSCRNTTETIEIVNMEMRFMMLTSA